MDVKLLKILEDCECLQQYKYFTGERLNENDNSQQRLEIISYAVTLVRLVSKYQIAVFQ